MNEFFNPNASSKISTNYNEFVERGVLGAVYDILMICGDYVIMWNRPNRLVMLYTIEEWDRKFMRL